MKTWLTELYAIGTDGEVYKWSGPRIDAYTMGLAQEWCELNGLGYLTVVGEAMCEDFGFNDPIPKQAVDISLN